MKKSLLFLTLCSLAFTPLLGACNNSNNNEEHQNVEEDRATINLNFNKDGGSVTYPEINYKIGSTLLLKVNPNQGYYLAYVKINDKKIRSTSDTFKYEIIEKIVNIEVLFEKINVFDADFQFEYDDENLTANIVKYSPDRTRVPYPFIVPETTTANDKTYKITGIKANSLDTSSVEKIVISKNISSIDSGTFSTVYGLKSIEVVSENTHFASREDCLYSKDFKTLIAVPTEYQGKSLTVKKDVETIEAFAVCNVRLIEELIVENGVKTIKPHAFHAMKSLIKATLPTTIKEIPDSCFKESVYLETVNIPEGVTKIGDHAFQLCAALTDVTFPTTLKEIGIETFYECKFLNNPIFHEGLEIVGNSAFGQCQNITEVIFPKSLIKIDDVAFEGCQLLRKVEFQTGLKYLGGAVFYKNPSLTDVTIPNTVETIHYNPFMGAGNAKLILEDGNKNYTMVDECLYTKDLTKLICVPYSYQPEKLEYRVPDSVTELGYNCFSLITYLNKITLPISITKMNCSFANILPSVITRKYETSIYYEGTPEQFNAIDHGKYQWNYMANFKDAVLHCANNVDVPLD